MRHYYFDHNATTPVAGEVLRRSDKSRPSFRQRVQYPPFRTGREAASGSARREIAARIAPPPAEIVFTSGGTESDNLAILGVSARRAAARNARHHQRHRTSRRAERLRATGAGRRGSHLPAGRPGWNRSVPRSSRALRPETVLITIMHANNEPGALQPIARSPQIARAAGAVFHADGVQAARARFPSMSRTRRRSVLHQRPQVRRAQGHRSALRTQGNPLAPIAFGGHHERDRRAGTGKCSRHRGLRSRRRTGGRRLAEEPNRHAARPTGKRHARPHSRNRRQWRALEPLAQYHQYPLRWHRRRSHRDRARSARLRGVQRFGLLERSA